MIYICIIIYTFQLKLFSWKTDIHICIFIYACVQRESKTCINHWFAPSVISKNPKFFMNDTEMYF